MVLSHVGATPGVMRLHVVISTISSSVSSNNSGNIRDLFCMRCAAALRGRDIPPRPLGKLLLTAKDDMLDGSGIKYAIIAGHDKNHTTQITKCKP
jgi:hypothetical protein